MVKNNLIEAFCQTILYFDLEQQWIDRNNGNISRSWKQNDINAVYVPMKMDPWQKKQIDKIIYTNNVGVGVLAKERHYASYNKIKKYGTKSYQSNDLSLKLNVWELTNRQKNEKEQSCSLIWSKRKLSRLLQQGPKVQNKMKWIE